MVILQLTMQVKAHREQQASIAHASAGLDPSAQQQLVPALAVGPIPAPLHTMLQQLGISSRATVWALTQSMPSFPSDAKIAYDLDSCAQGLRLAGLYSQQFMLSSTAERLSQAQELLQLLQLLTLLPAVLLQWLIDDLNTPGSYSSTIGQVALLHWVCSNMAANQDVQ
jgi:hypothetical protein